MADISSERLRKKIKAILRDADLSTLSAKKVRLKLQSDFDTDLSDRKKEIDQMTMSLIMEMEEKKKKEESEEEKEEEEEEEEQNGNDQSESEEEKEELPKKKSNTKDSSKKKAKGNIEDEPPKKKSKSKKSKIKEEDLVPLENDDLNVYDEEQKTLKLSDEELAKRLQAFEESGRRTRGKVAPKRKEKKKGGGSGTSAYSRPCSLSPDLAALMGTDKLARNEVVKKMWEIVKERKLQDPKDKRFMICDEQLLKIFGRRRVQTFGMMKYLAPHIRGDDSSSLEAVITNSDIYDDEADDDD